MSRRDWKLEPKIKCGWVEEQFAIIPTIIYYPWKHRYRGFSAFGVYWLGFYFEFGEWECVKR